MIRSVAKLSRSALGPSSLPFRDAFGELLPTQLTLRHPRAHLSPIVAFRFGNRQYVVNNASQPARKQDVETHIEETEKPGADSELAVPWYLKVDPPLSNKDPFLHRQIIPDLPNNPPPILQEVLDHISVDLGLDDLALLDLRHVDPPPALGANLLMILATARSEKHLHVSAERFCRWLRGTHKLSATADGLIGRGELKLKLKRKMRRAKILSRVGASMATDVDDGIRTGWICVNVTGLEEAPSEKLYQDLQHDYIGFGAATDKANLVVQMLTREKREVLDLESFWGQLGRRPEETMSNGRDDNVSSDHDGTLGKESREAASFSDANGLVTLLRARSGQVRHFHSYPSRFRRVPQGQPALNGSTSLPPFSPLSLRRDAKLSRPFQFLPSKRHVLEMRRLEPYSTANLEATQLEKESDRSVHAGMCVSSKEPLFPKVTECQSYCDLISSEHKTTANASQGSKIRLLRGIQATYIDIPLLFLESAIFALAKPPMSEKGLVMIAGALEGMFARNIRPINNQLRVAVQNALLASQTGGSNSISKTAFSQARTILTELLGPPSIEDELVTLAQAAEAAKWDEFWEVWRSFPISMRARPSEAYCIMFRYIARRRHQAEIMRCLRKFVPEMDLEEPPVKMDHDIAQAIRSCLAAAGLTVPGVAKEWERLSARCDKFESQDQEKTSDFPFQPCDAQ